MLAGAVGWFACSQGFGYAWSSAAGPAFSRSPCTSPQPFSHLTLTSWRQGRDWEPHFSAGRSGLTGKGSELPKVTQLNVIKVLSPDLLISAFRAERTHRRGRISLTLPLLSPPVLSSLLFNRYGCAKPSLHLCHLRATDSRNRKCWSKEPRAAKNCNGAPCKAWQEHKVGRAEGGRGLGQRMGQKRNGIQNSGLSS